MDAPVYLLSEPPEDAKPAKPGDVKSKPRERNHPFREWLIPAVLCAVMFGQLLFSSRQLTPTADEATHLYSGYRYLKCGDLTVSPEHPPLAKIVAAVPLLPMNPQADCTPFSGDEDGQAVSDFRWLYRSTDWGSTLFRARTAVSVFALSLCILVWVAARRMFGLGTAITATLLLVFEPTVLANGALIMTDMAVTATLFFAVFGFYLWTCQRSESLLLLTGLAAGLTLLSKHSGIVVIPILVVLAVADLFFPRDNKPPLQIRVLQNLLAIALVCVLATGIVWVGYGMRFAEHSEPALAQDRVSALSPTSAGGRVLLALEERRLLPQAYLEGFSILVRSTPVFILGKSYPHAQWFFFPLNLLIRSTAAFLVLALLSGGGVVLGFKSHRREILFLLIPASIFMAGCVRSPINGFIRYMLPMFPFLLIIVAAGCVELARRVRWMKYALPCLIVLHAASSLGAYPSYLSYANEFWGGPTHAYKYLPWIDIGQANWQAKNYLDRHPADPCWILTNWWWDPGIYGVHCKPIGVYIIRRIPPRLHGTVIVSSSLLTTTDEEQGLAAAPFLNEKPKDFIGGSALLVYEGDFDTSAAAAMMKWRWALHSGEPIGAALQDVNDAIALEPNFPRAHEARCTLLAESGQIYAAITECETAIRLAKGDSLHQAELQQVVEDTEVVLGRIRAAVANLPSP